MNHNPDILRKNIDQLKPNKYAMLSYMVKWNLNVTSWTEDILQANGNLKFLNKNSGLLFHAYTIQSILNSFQHFPILLIHNQNRQNTVCFLHVQNLT